MPGRRWYAAAAAVFLLTSAVAAWFLYSRMQALGAALPQVVVPGSAELPLREPGTYTIFHERESVLDGRYYSSGDISGLRVELASGTTGELVPLRAPTGSTSYSLGGRSGVSIFSFEIEEAGPYRLTATFLAGGVENRTVLAVGHNFGTKLVMAILGTMAIGLAGFIIAVTIAALTWQRRRRTSRVAESLRTSSMS